MPGDGYIAAGYHVKIHEYCISQSKVNLTEPGSHRAICRRTLQARLSYAAAARKALSRERPDSAASASPAAPSGQPSRTRESRPLDNQPTARTAAAPRGRQATAQPRDVVHCKICGGQLSRYSDAGEARATAIGSPYFYMTALHPISPLFAVISARRDSHDF
jgi:hypothetical protein